MALGWEGKGRDRKGWEWDWDGKGREEKGYEGKGREWDGI